jgi:hypothetical protein
MANAEGYVLPKPGIPKTLGILNVIFGVLLVLGGSCQLVMTVFLPAILQGAQNIAKDAQAKVEAQEKANLKSIDDQIAAAKTDEEKKALEQQRDAAAANKVQINPMDISAATDALKDPKIMAVSFGGIITGLILHILLLVSGIGLIRLTPWGRTLGVWWGVLMIVQVLGLLLATIFIALPANKPIQEKAIALAEEAAKKPGAGPGEASAAQMAKVMASLTVPMAVGQSLSGIVYPIVLLILLNTAGARAACLAKKPEGLDGF